MKILLVALLLCGVAIAYTHAARCIFPFKDSGKWCNGPFCCKTDGDSKAWCSTQVDANRKHVNGHYKYCYT